MATTKKDKKQQMQVFVRVRPLNKQEGYNSVVDVVSARELTVKHHGGLKKYIYDRVFGPESKQIDVYKLVAEPAVKEVMAGYNCTVLAYGQTGTGKTYTMAGGNVVDMSSTNSTAWFEDVHSGIIPRTMAHMFDELRVHQLEYTVRVSYLELYNEEIFDLLSPIEDTQKLKLYDDSMKKGSVIVNNLTETTVNSKAEVFQLLEKGTEKRKIASTLMNAQSSRSHTVFCITVHTKENSVGGEDLLKTGKLYLVDLAGSENIKQSGATDIRAREAVSINQSLLTLGRCITKLIEHSGHIPYRESKLTRLLQDSLGGRTKTTLIATVSPAACNTDETLNTLTYAHQAKSITNKPEINQRLSKKTLLKEYTEEIERLRKDLAANRMGTGVYLAEDNYEKMMRERESHKEELTEKIGQLRAMQEQMADKEKLCETLKISLEEHQKEVEVKVQTISTMKNQLDQLSQEITDLTLDNECRQFLVEQFSDTEKQLKSTAVELLNVADTTTGETHKLHDKLDILAELTKHNKQSCEQHIVEFNSKIDGISNKLRVFHDKEYAFHTKMAGMLITLTQKSTMFDSKWQELIEVLHTLNGSVSQQKLDVDCNAQCTQVEFELGQCNIAQVIKTSQDTCLNKYDSSLVEQVHKMSNSIHEQGKFVTELINNWQEMINKNFSQVTEFVESCKTLVLETKEEVKTRIENDMRLCKQIQNEMMNQLKDKKSFESALDAQYSNVLRALNDMKTLKEEHAKNSNEQSMQRLRDLGGLHDNLMDLHDACTKKSDNTCDYIDQFAGTLQLTKQNNHDTIEMTDTKRNNISDILDNSMETVNNLLHDHKEDVIASYKEIEEACNKELRAKADLVAETFATQSSGLQKTENDLVELKDSLETVVEEFCTTVNNSRVAMQSSVEENDKCCGEMDSLVGTELDNCREGFRRLYSSSLKEYKVTGETPQRKTYRYPRTLPETQPLKLMQQWRQMRLQEIEKSEELEEPDELEEKENKVNNSEQVSSGNEINLSKIPRHHATIKESVIDENENP